LTIFGRWLRERAHRIARAARGDQRAAGQLAIQDEADPLGVDLEETRQALLVSIAAEQARKRAEVEALVQERKEQSIIAALVFGCSCGSRWWAPPDDASDAWIISEWLRDGIPGWLRTHTHCAGLGAMAREDA
jgi:hypothetical protein